MEYLRYALNTLENQLAIINKVQSQLTLKEKVKITDEEKEKFDGEAKEAVETIVTKYFQEKFNSEKIERDREIYRKDAQQEIRIRYAQEFLDRLIEN